MRYLLLIPSYIASLLAFIFIVIHNADRLYSKRYLHGIKKDRLIGKQCGMGNLEILYPLAKTATGHWLHINNASPGVDVYCPECQGQMVSRLGEVKQHHFAHKGTRPPSCSGESAIHSLGKQILAYNLEQIGEIRFQTSCKNRLKLYCSQRSCLTIFHRLAIDHIVLEQHIETGYVPDLTVILRDGSKVFCEIVYKHPITDDKWIYYQESQTPIIVWNISSIDDALAYPFIKHSRGIHHGNIHYHQDFDGLAIYTDEKYHKTEQCSSKGKCVGIYYYVRKCWNCHRDIKVALFPTETCEELGFKYTAGWSNGEWSLAERVIKWNWGFIRQVRKESGIILEGRKSSILGSIPLYGLHTICPHCKRMQGQGWIQSDIEHGECGEIRVVSLEKELCGKGMGSLDTPPSSEAKKP